MSYADRAMARAAAFLARFLGVAGVLFLLWSFLAELYLSTLVVAFNHLAGPGIRFAVHGGSLAAIYTGLAPSPLVLQLGGNEVFYMNLLVAVGLLSATPVGSARRRLLSIALIAAIVWLTHLASLLAGEYLAIWDFLRDLSPAQAEVLRPRVLERYPAADERLARIAFDQFRVWGRPTLALLAWFYVSAEFLGLSQTGKAVGGA